MSEPGTTAEGAAEARGNTLEEVVAGLRRLAMVALDAGHPLVAAQIASTADRVEAETWPLPPRPRYGRGR
jgi:hypothetical protein